MNPYSHLVVAAKLESIVKPENLGEYYWGAVAPDGRYPAHIGRSQTHLAPEEILALIERNPPLKSFLQGYLVHCVADEIVLEEIFFQHFPFSLFKRYLTRQNLAVSLELYYFEHEKVNAQGSGAYNTVLSEVGLSETVCTKFATACNHYALSSSRRTRFVELFQMLGLSDDSRSEGYLRAMRVLQKNPFLISAVFFGIRSGKISAQIIDAITEKITPCNI